MNNSPLSKRAAADKLLEKLRSSGTPDRSEAARRNRPQPVVRRAADFSALPEYQALKLQRATADMLKIDVPFFRQHEGRAADTTTVEGHKALNFSTYDYLGLNGDPRIVAAAKQAIDRYGTSVGASRPTAGERPIYHDLEAAMAKFCGTEAALSFVSGHATNVSVIGCLLNAKDVIFADALAHNSLIEGAKLSGATCLVFPHNDCDALEALVREHRSRFRRAMIVVEGLYSMDGDVPDMGRLLAIKRRYDAWLLVDEAHSDGVLGERGRGIAEEQGIDPGEVEIWMGTLSKAFASTGGYIAGSQALIDYLKTHCPGFVYSVGLPPVMAASALAALQVIEQEPERVAALRANGSLFLQRARAAGLDVGQSIGASVIPVVVGDTLTTVVLANRLLDQGLYVIPIIFPAVGEKQARLRFFMTARHTAEQIKKAVDLTAQELSRLRKEPPVVSGLAGI
ncbi:aminotransferase class I/II-fold pyridoxal phosphate-dependent enzyme [Pseudorhodoplanes sinuspersici]|uniref:8-amino-7-oxononanoate synthase n=1 Tax=Pseudorhodoplanes sinuspersici TaxID=1235591 RepID=A0A1W6ZYA4_9HYPH|nr:aminotransferase class I/II-fold pyridoxal phosphate-dependent enzyme [Pseudorhodoplanes sinuspersici]ARQ02300.1 8-amino-7-oxononanoate synthase [Pseudorhodoplanes sinuspersici]RKE74128.1 8-amino-7-oxononanoate synthase [Pseudorhodoplanes sinuspersici]